jgi:hypothetical protein
VERSALVIDGRRVSAHVVVKRDIGVLRMRNRDGIAEHVFVEHQVEASCSEWCELTKHNVLRNTLYTINE